MPVLVTLFAFVIVHDVSAQQKDSDWPQFRGPTGQGVSTDKNVPLKWGPNQNIAWKTELPGSGRSSPIVFGQRIYVTAFTGNDPYELHLLALNRADGKQVWAKKIAHSAGDQPLKGMRENHGYASSTPCADATGIYCFFGKTGVFAFDHDGNERWRKSVGQGFGGFGSGASPVLYENLVIINAGVEGKALVALDKKSGNEVWRAKGNAECSWNTPILLPRKDGKAELVLAMMPNVLGLDPATGKQNWSCRTDIRWYMVPGLVSDGDIVGVIGGRDGVTSLAVKLGGQGDVTKSHRLWTSMKGSNVSSPILHDGHLYWMNDNTGVAFCAVAATGKVVYEERVAPNVGIYSSPVLAEGRIYYLTRNGRTVVVPAAPRFEELASNDLGEKRTQFNSSQAFAGSKIFIRSDRYLYCIGK